MRIVEYKTVTADNTELLDQKVNLCLAEGFQPYGNPYLSGNKVLGKAGDSMVTQVMVKYTDE